ncbi:threonine/serine exporter family protein [Guggenheimella bovis]
MTNQTAHEFIRLALRTGELLLINGAETYRVEETMDRMCLSRGVDKADAFVTPTGLFFSIEMGNETLTKVRRIKRAAIDLDIIEELNDFARKFSASDMSIEEANLELDRISQIKHFPENLEVIAGGFTCASFSMLFGASFYDLPLAFITGCFLRIFLIKIRSFTFGFFLDLLLGSFLFTLFIYLGTHIFPHINTHAVTIGMIMQMVPGVAITMSIRDTLTGDFLSGVSRLNEAVFIALAIAFGVGVGLLAIQMMGGIL